MFAQSTQTLHMLNRRQARAALSLSDAIYIMGIISCVPNVMMYVLRHVFSGQFH